MIRWTIFFALLAIPALAADLPARVRVPDGDTFTATIRLQNVDAPEIRGRCAEESALAARSRDFAAAWIARNAARLTIRSGRVDRYGRLIARVEADGEDLGEALIAAGLARPWRGRREDWC